VRVHVVAIHGIGQGRREGFSRRLRDRVVGELESIAPDSARRATADLEHFWRECIWDVGLPAEELFRRLYPGGDPTPFWARRLLHRLGLPTAREFAFCDVGDIVSYFAVRDRVMEGLRRQISGLAREHRDRGACLALVGHSMWSVVAFDFLHESQRREGPTGRWRSPAAAKGRLVAVGEGAVRSTLVASALFTLGSPIALFSLVEEGRYHHFRGRLAGEDAPFCLAEGWFNFYDEEDPIPFPVARLFGSDRLRVTDYKVDNCRLPLLGALFSHGGYWFCGEVAKELARHIARMEGTLKV